MLTLLCSRASKTLPLVLPLQLRFFLSNQYDFEPFTRGQKFFAVLAASTLPSPVLQKRASCPNIGKLNYVKFALCTLLIYIGSFSSPIGLKFLPIFAAAEASVLVIESFGTLASTPLTTSQLRAADRCSQAESGTQVLKRPLHLWIIGYWVNHEGYQHVTQCSSWDDTSRFSTLQLCVALASGHRCLAGARKLDQH